MSAPRIDPALVERARAGDDAALAELLAAVEPMIYRFGVKLCGHPEDARGVLQETMISMVESLRSFRGEAALSSWLYAVARGHCHRKRRTSKFAPRQLESLEQAALDVPGEAALPDEELERRRTGRALQSAIAALDAGHREVLVLRDVEGLPAREVAAIMGLSVAAVKSRLHRARAAVRERLVADLEAPAAGCPDVALMLSRKLEDELSPAVCAEMEAHVAGCPRCAGRCDSLRRTLAACQAAGQEGEVPENVKESVAAAIRSATGRNV